MLDVYLKPYSEGVFVTGFRGVVFKSEEQIEIG